MRQEAPKGPEQRPHELRPRGDTQVDNEGDAGSSAVKGPHVCIYIYIYMYICPLV